MLRSILHWKKFPDNISNCKNTIFILLGHFCDNFVTNTHGKCCLVLQVPMTACMKVLEIHKEGKTQTKLFTQEQQQEP